MSILNEILPKLNPKKKTTFSDSLNVDFYAIISYFVTAKLSLVFFCTAIAPNNDSKKANA